MANHQKKHKRDDLTQNLNGKNIKRHIHTYTRSKNKYAICEVLKPRHRVREK